MATTLGRGVGVGVGELLLQPNAVAIIAAAAIINKLVSSRVFAVLFIYGTLV